jgi:hypothetical protein
MHLVPCVDFLFRLAGDKSLGDRLDRCKKLNKKNYCNILFALRIGCIGVMPKGLLELISI